jgi:hypothetical protein
VYQTDDPAPDQRGFEVRRPDPPALARLLPLLPDDGYEEYDGDE